MTFQGPESTLTALSLFSRILLSPPRCASARRLRSAVAGKTVVITGASYGIGEATSHLFADAGATVILVARTKDKLGELVEQSVGGVGKPLPILATSIMRTRCRIWPPASRRHTPASTW